MALVNITRKTSTLQGYQLVAPSDMQAALAYLATRGYVGSVSTFKSGSTLVWQLNLSQANGAGTAMTAFINDWIVIENDTIATVVTAAQAPNMYTIT